MFFTSQKHYNMFEDSICNILIFTCLNIIFCSAYEIEVFCECTAF